MRNIINELRNIEETTPHKETAKAIHKARRDLERIEIDQLKQGPRIPCTREFIIECQECHTVLDNQELYVQHLLQEHNFALGDAEEHSEYPRFTYDIEIFELRTLLSKYTEYQLEEF